MDFTIDRYKELLSALINAGYKFLTFSEFCSAKPGKTVVLRHDVDKLPACSLRFAHIQSELGIKGSYYFRAVPESWDEKIILKIAELGHEVGYHYESLSTCNGDTDAAYNDFCNNLNKLRKLVKVDTICMHGSPKSKFDNKDIWKKYNYKTSGIIAEPYLDIDFNNVFYLTDSGRRWDGYKVVIRDRIPFHQEKWNNDGLVFRSTQHIIHYAGKLPPVIMFTFHPQRWHSKMFPWIKELTLQNARNQVKFFMKKTKNNNPKLSV